MSDVTISPEVLKSALVAKASEDDAFRAALLANPQAAFEQLLGTALPPQIKLQAVEEAADTYIVVLPAKVAVGVGGELTDADLEAVAGGSKAGANKFFTDVARPVAQLGSSFGGIGTGVGNLATNVVEGNRLNQGHRGIMEGMAKSCSI